jgi:tetratricopeptide (TPR) repeat protein
MKAWLGMALMAWAASPAMSETLETPAEQRIALAEEAIARDPARFQAYNALALALARRARETADTSYYARAQEAVEQSLRLSADNLEAQRLQVWILLGQHEFPRALEEARTLNRRVPDDVLTYAMLVDAHVELGNYREAEEAAQWMLDLRPGNVPGLTRAAHLRELFGDIEGAIDLMGVAYQSTPAAEREDRAWILTQIGHLELSRGRLESADELLTRALEIFPAYHYALANLARLRAAQGRPLESVELLRQRYQAAPHPENLADLAGALARAGRANEAATLFAEFEEKALAESEGWDNANRELIFYYADRASKPAEALSLARREVERRRDVYTVDAYAWALSLNGKPSEARSEIESALAVGIQDAKLFYHAGAIASRQGDSESAARYLKKSLELNPFSEVAAEAREALARPKDALND